MSEQRKDKRPSGAVASAPGGSMRGPGGPRGMRPGGGPMAGMMMVGEKPKDFKGTLRRLIGYLRPQMVAIVVVCITAILSTVFSIISPKVMGKATTKLFEFVMMKLHNVPGAAVDFPYIGRIVLILIGLYLISSLFSYVQQFIMAGVAQKTVYQMRKDVNAKLAHLPLKFYDSRAHGEILSRVTNDVDNVANTLQQSLTQLITSVVTLVGVVVMMLTISPTMTLILIVTLPLYVVTTKLIASRSQKYFAAQQRVLGDLNGHVEEMYGGHKIVKAFGREQESIGRFNQINNQLYESAWRAQFISGIIMPLMNFINNIGYVIICVIGGVFVTQQRIAIGDIQAFIQYSRQFTHPIVQTASIANILQSTVASAERVFELLDEVEETPDGPVYSADEEQQLPQTLTAAADVDSCASGQDLTAGVANIAGALGEVHFQHVKFGYAPDDTLIKDMNIDVRPGQTVAIVGPTGAGKTTLVNLLMRFYEVDGGRITVNGTDIREWKRGDLRKTFGMVLQDTWLFNGTIRDNIAYGREGATEEEVVRAARAAHADHFIRTLPDGYDTVLNEEASNISQGQKQLLTIARAILADPAILILDEATSSVDTRTEIIIQRAMAELMQGRTSFVIAHRLSTIRDADLILVMNHGSIIEQGTHQSLLAQDGFYADLYNSQFTANGRVAVGQVG